MSIDTLQPEKSDIARNELLQEVLLRTLAKGAWGDGKIIGDEEHDYMFIAVGERSTRYMSNSDFGRYVIDRFGFGIWPDLRDRAYDDPPTEYTFSWRDELNGVYSAIGEDVFDRYANSTKGLDDSVGTGA